MQARRVVRHEVHWSWEVVNAAAVTEGSLVVAGELAEVGSRARGRHRAFEGAGHGRGVVTHGLEGGVGDGMAVGHDVMVCEDGGIFQVAVGDVAGRVVGRHEGGLDVVRKREAPVVAAAGVVEVHAAHALSSSIGGAKEQRELGHKFSQVGRPSAEARCEAGEGVQVAAHEGVEAHAVGASLVLRPLQGAEQSLGSRDGHGHEAELAEHAAPALSAHPLGSLEFREEVVEHELAVRRELDGLAH